eukprot:scaffold12538_cov21-Tisochrysis_lutea.AAC.4
MARKTLPSIQDHAQAHMALGALRPNSMQAAECAQCRSQSKLTLRAVCVHRSGPSPTRSPFLLCPPSCSFAASAHAKSMLRVNGCAYVCVRTSRP